MVKNNESGFSTLDNPIGGDIKVVEAQLEKTRGKGKPEPIYQLPPIPFDSPAPERLNRPFTTKDHVKNLGRGEDPKPSPFDSHPKTGKKSPMITLESNRVIEESHELA